MLPVNPHGQHGDNRTESESFVNILKTAVKSDKDRMFGILRCAYCPFT